MSISFTPRPLRRGQRAECRTPRQVSNICHFLTSWPEICHRQKQHLLVRVHVKFCTSKSWLFNKVTQGEWLTLHLMWRCKDNWQFSLVGLACQNQLQGNESWRSLVSFSDHSDLCIFGQQLHYEVGIQNTLCLSAFYVMARGVSWSQNFPSVWQNTKVWLLLELGPMFFIYYFSTL